MPQSKKQKACILFFSCKTHKPGEPFRAIVTERSTWQQQVASFIQKQLSSLRIPDPLAICNSEAVVRYLRENKTKGCNAFSVDVQDLFYSIPHTELLKNVKLCICEDNDEVKFRNDCGVPVESFMEVLFFYLSSTFVGWNEAIYVQKSGICIGSKVAPLLSDIFLARVDQSIHSAIGSLAKNFPFC